MRSTLENFIHAMPGIVVVAISLIMFAIFLMWLFLPFAIYGLKKKQNEQIQVLRDIQVQLKSDFESRRPEAYQPREPKIQ